MNKDAQGRWKVGMSNIKLKIRVQIGNGVLEKGTPTEGPRAAAVLAGRGKTNPPVRTCLKSRRAGALPRSAIN